METRTITILSTKTQRSYQVETNATTLGELKQALSSEGIDYEGMTFTEGLTKSILTDDSSQLPKDVMYKGNVTNNLVFRLTSTGKNIKSGIRSREELYIFIKEHSLQNMIKSTFNKNFTNVPTKDLDAVVSKYIEDAVSASNTAHKIEEAIKDSTPMDRLVKTLQYYEILTDADVRFILKGTKNMYSQEELDEMFN